MPSLLHMCSPSPAWSPIILHPAGRCSFKLHDFLVSMSVGKEQHSTPASIIDSSSEDDDVVLGPGYVCVNMEIHIFRSNSSSGVRFFASTCVDHGIHGSGVAKCGLAGGWV